MRTPFMLHLTHHNLFSTIAPYLPENPIIVEAGSFDGRDTIRLHRQWPAATIHAFEPVPEIFQMLQDNTREIPNIVRHPYALSDVTGTAIFYVSESPKRPGKPFQAGSLLEPKERLKLSD